MSDSAASRRADELQKKLGFDIYARYPVDLVEFRMDRPPINERDRGNWKPVLGPKTRVYATYMRYSWCWPFCWEYAVVADDRDEIMWEAKGAPKVLTEEAVADILGLSRQRVQNVVLDLVADKLIRVERVRNSQHALAVYLEAKPVLTAEDRRCKSTLAATGVDGPRLEPAQLRRFTNLLKQLGDDDDAEIAITDKNQVIRVGEYRTLIWQAIIGERTSFLGSLKDLRMSERKRYAEIATQVRDVIQVAAPVNGKATTATATPPPPTEPAAAPPRPAPTAQEMKSFAPKLKEKFAGKGSQPTVGQCDQAFATLFAKERSREVFLQWLTPEKMRPIKSAGAVMTLVKEFDGVCEDWERQRAAGEDRARQHDERTKSELNLARAKARTTLADPHATTEQRQWAREDLDLIGEEDEL